MSLRFSTQGAAFGDVIRNAVALSIAAFALSPCAHSVVGNSLRAEDTCGAGPGCPGYEAASKKDEAALPIVKVAPVYPKRAMTRKIEGHVLLEFTVTEEGAVSDPVVVEADPPGVFDESALTAVRKFRYKPAVVDGKAVERAGVRNRIVFEISNRPATARLKKRSDESATTQGRP